MCSELRTGTISYKYFHELSFFMDLEQSYEVDFYGIDKIPLAPLYLHVLAPSHPSATSAILRSLHC